MDWIELSAEVPAEHVDAVAAAVTDVVPAGCSIQEPVVLLGPEEGFRREPWRPSTVHVYLPVDDRAGERIEEIRRTSPLPLSWSARKVQEDDWANAWKAFFHAERIGGRLVVRPSWEAYAPRPGEIVIDLDPGMAFGTGQHETTRMCLIELDGLDERLGAGATVLDLGCGSGILAVAAARLGASAVDAVDVEAVAVEAARANAARNGVANVVRVAGGSLDGRWPFGPLPNARYDLVLANIHATAVSSLAPAIFAALRLGGVLVGSGIIAERLGDVERALAVAGFGAPKVRAAAEWRTVVAERPVP